MKGYVSGLVVEIFEKPGWLLRYLEISFDMGAYLAYLLAGARANIGRDIVKSNGINLARGNYFVMV